MNILMCRVKNCEGGEDSLELLIDQLEETPTEYSKELVERVISWIDWKLVIVMAKHVRSLNADQNRGAAGEQDRRGFH